MTAFQPVPKPESGLYSTVSGGFDEKLVSDHMKIQLLVRAHQVRGHHLSNLDPLNIAKPLDAFPAPELDIGYYGFTEKDLDREFFLGSGILARFSSQDKMTMTLREIQTCLKEVYCGTIGFEYTHIPDRERCEWIRSRIEVPEKYKFTKEQKLSILDRLTWSDSFERFLHGKYPGEKRFGLEGCESLIPGMKSMIDRAVEHGVEHVTIGMPHRGRLNVLSNVVRKPNESLFCEFNGQHPNTDEGSGDVKYHLGMSYDRKTPTGKQVRISLAANPSHLEAVNPVVQGRTRALQFYSNDISGDKSLGILLHGDASFAAQGVVYESLGMCELPSYSTGGTIHIIVNNQIGFTTDPRFARSTPYCSDIAKSINAPILHVNADDVEAVIFACNFASDWRKLYKTDIVIDIVCYRRHGHNEFDEPFFTQPRMYSEISKKERVISIYSKQLLAEGVVTQEEIDAISKKVWANLEEKYELSKSYKPTSKEWITSAWEGFKSPKEIAEEVTAHYDSGISELNIQAMTPRLTEVPESFSLHKGVARILKGRKQSLESGIGIDMPTAESLAFGSLLVEGKHVRLSGQDVERGTFSQRHAVLHDQVTEEIYIPLSKLSPEQAKFTVCNSSLSEFGTLGFELGYSLVNPNSLILWEAQFGDFANNAQCIIDQFIVSGEKKWLQRTGLTVLLPHGYDGSGPEHSNGRIERFLQWCDDDPYTFVNSTCEKSRQIQDCNIQVVYPSTPANYFHVLRRQVHRDFRKPLIVFNSKNLMRHPLAKSPLSDFLAKTRFRRVISDPLELDPVKVKRVVFCSGQVYYTLHKAREANKLENVALIRIEQISPFPFNVVAEDCDLYPNADIIWCQEEHMNLGPWSYVEPRIETSLKKTKHHATKRPRYTGRSPSASSATGFKKQHLVEEYEFISDALYGKIKPPKKIKKRQREE